MPELQLRSLQAYIKAFNRHDAKAVAALYAPDAVFIERGSPASANREAIIANFQDYFDAYPDVTTSITRSWHWGDAALFEYVEGGTQSGERIVIPPAPQALDPLAGEIAPKAQPRRIQKPTGKKFGYIGASLLRFNPDGLIRQDMTYADELTREVQSGWAPGQLAKLPVRPVIPVPPASDTWEVHKLSGLDVGQPQLVAARTSLYKKFSLRSEKDFLGALTDDVLLASFDDPADAKGKAGAAALFKEWTTMFADGVVDATDGWSVDGYAVLIGTYTGKHVGAWGPIKPTQKPFKTHFLDIAKLNKDGKVERLWSYANNYELLQYLGYEKDDGTGDPKKR
jgi:ketosteroid isomerase-like protein